MEAEGNFDYNNIWEKISSREILLIDTRIVSEYSRKHIPGALCAPYSKSGWGNAVARYLGKNSIEIAILGANEAVATAARNEMENQGYKVVAVIPDGTTSWESLGLPIAEMWEITPEDLQQNLGEYTVLDVREPYEWQSGVVPGALKISMNELPYQLEQLSKDKKYAIICATGTRSQSAALYLADNGFDAGNVVGGMARWISRSLPVKYE